MHLSDAFIQSDLQCIQAIHVFISISASWELNTQPFALLTQGSATERVCVVQSIMLITTIYIMQFVISNVGNTFIL